jgi:hypothetical protein
MLNLIFHVYFKHGKKSINPGTRFAFQEDQEAFGRQVRAQNSMDAKKKTQIAIFANGCFWCSEAVFKSLKGVVAVASGYIGGDMSYP